MKPGRRTAWLLVFALVALGATAPLAWADDDDDEVALTGLTIVGKTNVNEGTTTNYVARATFSNGSTANVTSRATWSENSSYASMSSAGILVASSVTSLQTVTLTARYSSGGVTRTASKTVRILNVAPTLSSLAVTGRTSLNEGTSTQYRATATMSDGSTKIVTSAATWSVSGSAATMSAGTLTAGQVSSNQTVKVTASYTSGGVTKTASMNVTIRNVSASVTLSSLAVSGASSVNEGTTSSYTATATMSDGTTSVVTSASTWSVSGSAATMSGGTLTAGQVSSNQTVTVTASYTSGGITKSATKSVTIVDVPVPVTLSSLAVSGASSVNEGTTSSYTATATMSDGTTSVVTSASTWSVSGSAATISGGTLTAGQVSSNQTVTVTASYTSGGITKSATKVVTIADVAPPVTGSHAGRFTSYNGTATCLQCHNDKAVAMHGSDHYQWKASSADVVGTNGQPMGKLGSINDFCIYPDINWIGKLTTVDGAQVDGGCAKCHVGLGAKPVATASPTQAQLENIDCLICHAPGYKRTVDPVTKAKFIPDEVNMTVSILQAASDIQLPTRDTCLNCHTKSGGGNNFKRGDIEEHHRNPATRAFDVHMSSTTLGGGGLNCIDCHEFVDHKVMGRGSDLKGRDLPDALSCTKCHASAPHGDSKLDKHVARVNCTVCHIPTFAKVAPTDMMRDWSLPGVLDIAKGLYDPVMDLQANQTPVYRFWDGKSKFYHFNTTSVAGASGYVSMSEPEGAVTTTGSKIYAFKHHTAVQPMDSVTDVLLPLKIGIFYQTGDVNAAAVAGRNELGMPANAVAYQNTERYMGLFHEVSPKEQALSCTNCHTTTNPRLDFKALGYAAKKPTSDLCNDCHGLESYTSYGFTNTHEKHTSRYNCSSCHNFSRAQ